MSINSPASGQGSQSLVIASRVVRIGPSTPFSG
jgi:hypothetical protein